ncbi:MAG: hypothetical protein Q8N22_03370 [bacterium]|nr:hypothetical protein [bacterium]
MDTIINYLLNFRNSTIDFFMPYFGWIKFISLIISGLLLWGIIYCVKKLSFFNSKIEQYMDILRIGDLSKHRSIRGWQQIQKRLQAGDEENFKLAITEADRILDELLKISGYQGKNMDERLGQITQAQLFNISDAWSAHKIKQRILKEEDFHINKQEAELIINIYKKSFQELELID